MKTIKVDTNHMIHKIVLTSGGLRATTMPRLIPEDTDGVIEITELPHKDLTVIRPIVIKAWTKRKDIATKFSDVMLSFADWEEGNLRCTDHKEIVWKDGKFLEPEKGDAVAVLKDEVCRRYLELRSEFNSGNFENMIDYLFYRTYIKHKED